MNINEDICSFAVGTDAFGEALLTVLHGLLDVIAAVSGQGVVQVSVKKKKKRDSDTITDHNYNILI